MSQNSAVYRTSYLGKVERVEATRDVAVMEEKAEMLRSYGFNVAIEVHAGFFLIHWTFPEIELVWPPKTV